MDRLLGFVAGGGKYFVIFALIVTALSNVTLIKENMHKYVKDSMLYPILYKAGTAIIQIDPKSLGLHSTPIVKSVETNTTTDTQSHGN
jgi:membrane protein required for colicin V production